MAKKVERTERSYENPDLAWKDKDGSLTKIFILGEDEFIFTHTSTNYNHSYRGPSLVIERVNVGSRSIDEHYVNHKQTWKWISRLLKDGLGKYNLTLLSETDEN